MKIIKIIVSIFFAIALLILSVKVTLNFRYLYYFDIDYLKITEISNMSREEIIENYDVMIDYLSPTYKGQLKFPSLPMSERGEQHFIDVKNIFVFLEKLLLISLLVTISGIFYLHKKKDYSFYRLTSIFLIGIPLIFIIPILIDFKTMFTLFHKTVFRNDYWLLNPETDPVILLLPRRFFMHSALLILVLLTIAGITLNFLYSYNVKRYVSKIKD